MGIIGCAQVNARASARSLPPAPGLIVAVLPVANLSDSSEWDPVRVTDMIASEFLAFPGLQVVPVNRVLAMLAARGSPRVTDAADAAALAEALGADLAVLVAITEFAPYDPPRVGIVMQWYPTHYLDGPDLALAAHPADEQPSAPVLWRAQRVYDGADENLREELQAYSDARPGHESPFDWRVHTKSQQLFLRYCCWSLIRTMLITNRWAGQADSVDEAEAWASASVGV